MEFMGCSFSNPRTVRSFLIMDIEHGGKSYPDVLFDGKSMFSIQTFRACLDKKVAKILGKGYKQADMIALLNWAKSEAMDLKEARRIGYDHEAPSLLIPYGGHGRLLDLLTDRTDTYYAPRLIGERPLYTYKDVPEEDWRVLASRVVAGYPKQILISLMWALASPFDSRGSNEYYPILNVEDNDFAQFLADIMGHNRIPVGDSNQLVKDASVSNSQFVYIPNYKLKKDGVVSTIRCIWQNMDDYVYMVPYKQIANVLISDFGERTRASLPGRVVNVSKSSYKRKLLEEVPVENRQDFALGYVRWLAGQLPKYGGWREEAMERVPKKEYGGRNMDIIMHMLIAERVYQELCGHLGIKSHQDIVMPYITKPGVLV